MAEETSNSKKWLLWGCGGCLGLSLLTAVVVGVIATMGVSSFQKGSEEAFHKIYGDKATPPAGYLLIAVPMPEGNLVTLTSVEKNESIITVDTKATDEQLAILKSADPESIKTMMQAQGASSGSSNIKIDSQHVVVLGNGKSLVVAQGTLEKDGETHPAAISLIPQNGRLIYAISMGLEGNADRAELETDLVKLVNDSEIDARIPE